MICVRCGSANPLLSDNGSECVVCGHKFVYSFISFEILPLVEFQLEAGLSDAEAKKMMNMMPTTNPQDVNVGFVDDGEAQTLAIGDDDGAMGDGNDLFTKQLMDTDHGTSTKWPMITVDAKTLKGFNPREVFRVTWDHPAIKTRYFRSIISCLDNPIVQCPRCQRFFNEEEFEAYALQHGRCPVCRLKLVNYAKEQEEDEDPLEMIDSQIY